MKKLFKINYEYVKQRGLINEDTTRIDFVNKMESELEEFRDEIFYKKYDNSNKELFNLILVIASYIIHYNIKIKFPFLRSIIDNKTRAAKHKNKLAVDNK